MNRYLFAGIILGIMIGVGFSPQIVNAIYSIPPTDAFRYIFVGSDPDDNVTASTYNGNATFIEGGGVTIVPNWNTGEITFSSGAGSAALEQLTNVTDVGCALNQIIKVNATGFWDCASDNTGGSSTLESLTNVTDIGCANNQVIKVNSSGAWDCANDTDTGATNLDGLSDVIIGVLNQGQILFYNGVNWINENFKLNNQTVTDDYFLVGINNITGMNTMRLFSVDTTTCGGSQKVSSINNSTGTVTCTDDQDSADATTASNIGTGVGVFDAEVGNDLQFNSLIGGAGIDVTDTTDDLTIDIDATVLTTSSGLEKLGNVTDVGCAANEIRKVSGGNWVCATDSGGAETLAMEQLSNVTNVGCAAGQVLAVSGANWVCTTPAVGTITSINGDGAAAQVFSGTTANVTITDTGAGTLTFDTAWNYVTTNLAAQVISKSLTINTLILGGLMNVAGNTLDNVGLIADNSGAEAGAGFIRMGNTAIIGWEASPASTDLTITSDASENLVLNSGWNNVDLGLNAMINSIFDVAGTGNRLTATSTALGDILKSDGTDFKRLARGSNGQVLTATASDIQWSTPSSGSGIPLPPKKWGNLIPTSPSASLQGLAVGCSILATATYVYDVTDASAAILSTTAITDGVNGGIHCVATDRNVFTGAKNAYMYSRWEENKITTNRIFIGFSGAAATILPNNADTIVDSIDAAGLCIRTSDTVYQFCSNDGTGVGVYATLTTSEDTGVHYFEVYTTDAGITWCGKLDGGTAVCSSTAADIPTTTDRLFATSTGETDGGATAILWTQYQWYIESGR